MLKFKEAEEAAIAKQQRIDAHAAHKAAAALQAAEAAEAANAPNNYLLKSPSDYSCRSYESFICEERIRDDQHREKMSIKSVNIEADTDNDLDKRKTNMTSLCKSRKVSTTSLSLPGSPFNLRRRRSSRGSHQFFQKCRKNNNIMTQSSERKPLVLSTYLDAQEHLPYADDSNAVTPMSEENGAIILPSLSYNCTFKK